MNLPSPEILIRPTSRINEAMNAISDSAMKQKLFELQKMQNKYYSASQEADINHKNALTGRIPIENELTKAQINRMPYENALTQAQASRIPIENSQLQAEVNSMPLKQQFLKEQLNQLKLENQFYPEKTKADIQYKKRLIDNPGGLGVGGREQLFYQANVGKDNPQLKTPEQVYEAANVLSEGGNQLKDGTPLNPLSPAAKASLDRVIRGSTTAPLITQSIKANQAEKELQVFDNLSKQYLKPYANTFFNKSIDQIKDTFKNDDESQTRLGKFIAGQAAQYEASQMRIRLAGGEPGASATEELMGRTKQVIDAKYPRLSAKAREIAADTLDDILAKGLKARNSVGLHPSEIGTGGSTNQSKSENDPLGIRG